MTTKSSQAITSPRFPTSVTRGSDHNSSSGSGRVRLDRFWLLDNLRGLASLSVVIWHYQHFYFSRPGSLPASFDLSVQPLYSFLWPFYTFGFNAVQLFFILSGFVFFFVYYDAVCDRAVTGFQFFILRFSRLYPLHFATLIFVALGQWVSIRSTGHFTVYVYNDLYYFVPNCLLISNWGLQAGESFNGPIWSVSVEVLLYLLFFVYASQIAARSSWHLRNCVAVWVALLAVQRVAPVAIAELLYAALCFFAGGIVFFAWQRIAEHKRSHRLVLLAAVFVGGLTGFLLFVVTGYRPTLHFILFPTLVLFLAIAQSLFLDAGQRSRVIGDVSYSTYLLHFPLQLSIILLTAYVGIKIDFDRPVILGVFFVILLFISIAAFYYFERPMLKYIRKKMVRIG